MTRAFLLSHNTVLEGPIDFYAAYLRAQGHEVTTASHPLDDYAGRASEYARDGAWGLPVGDGGLLCPIDYWTSL